MDPEVEEREAEDFIREAEVDGGGDGGDRVDDGDGDYGGRASGWW